MMLKGPRPHRYHSGYQAKPRHMKLGRALRVPTVPFAGESLVGLVARATAHHVLFDVTGVLRRAGLSIAKVGSVSRVHPDLVVALAPILKCAPDDILSRLTPLASPDAVSSDIVFGDSVLRPFDVERRVRRISPLALAEHPFHREAWLIGLLPYCPVSFELLRSDCSDCGKPLGWTRSRGIGFCESCDAPHPIAPTDAPLLAAGLHKDYVLFADIVSSDRERHNAALAELAPAPRGLDARTLVEVIVSIGFYVSQGRGLSGRKSLRSIPGERLAEVVSTGAAMMRNWPQDFRAWAASEAESLKDDTPAFLAHRRAVRMLGLASHVPEPQVRFIREALPDMFACEHRGFAEPGEVMTKREAADFLTSNADTLTAMFDAGMIPGEKVPTRAGHHLRFRRSEITRIRDAREVSDSWQLFGRIAGLPLYALEQMVCLGIIDQEADPSIMFLRGGWSINKCSIADLWAQMVGCSVKTVPPADAIALGTATRRFGGGMKCWGAMFDALRTGAIAFWIPDPVPSREWVRRVMVRPTDLDRFEGVTFDRGDFDFNFSATCGIMAGREILNLLATRGTDLIEILAEEIAARPQVKPELLVDLNTILDMARKTISIAEICARKGWSPRRLKWQILPFAHARTPCGWDRKTIEGSSIFSK